MLELLQARGRVSGAELADRLEVDRRTIRRYAVRLTEMGFPVDSDRGPYGGYRLRPGYKLPPLMLTEDEATAVVLGLVSARAVGILTASSPVEPAAAKVLQVLPDRLRRRVAALERSLDGVWRTRDTHPPATEVILVLAEAIQDQRRVRVRHATPRAAASDRAVDPYGLVFATGHWYLAGRDHRSGQNRTFRVDRIHEAELLRERAPRPADFDVTEHVTGVIARTPRRWEVEVLLDTSLEQARRRVPPTVAELETTVDGVVLRSTEYDLDRTAARLAGYGWPFTVRRPDELRDAVGRLAVTLAAAARPGNASMPEGQPARVPQ